MTARQRIEDRARELGCFPDPENYTDTQLLDAIKAEQAAASWLDRLEQLPTDEAKRDAVHRLAQQFAAIKPDGTCDRCGKPAWRDRRLCAACFYADRAAAGLGKPQ